MAHSPKPDTAHQEWCRNVIASRFKQFVTGFHQRPIEKQSLIMPERLRPCEESEKLQRTYGFRFSAFWELLKKLGIIDILDRTYHSGDRRLFALNFLNGGLGIDYLKVFAEHVPGIEKYLQRLSQEKYGRDLAPHGSNLSVADFLFVSTLCKLTAPMRNPEPMILASIQLCNTTTGMNKRHIETMRLLSGMVEAVETFRELFGGEETMSLESAHRALGLPVNHSGFFNPLKARDSASSAPIDVFVPLHGGDLELACLYTRYMAIEHENAVIIPSGGQAPLQAKELGRMTEFSEAEEMIAILTCDMFQTQSAWKAVPHYMYDPWKIRMAPHPPVSLDRIMHPDTLSGSTAQNAEQVALALEEIRHQKGGRPLTVAIVTTIQHSARAWAEFRNRLQETLVADLKVAGLFDSPFYPSHNHWLLCSFALGNIFAEYIKRLYMVSVK